MGIEQLVALAIQSNFRVLSRLAGLNGLATLRGGGGALRHVGARASKSWKYGTLLIVC